MLQIIAQHILVIPYGVAVFVGQLFPLRIFFRRETEVFRGRIRLIFQFFKPSEIRVFSQLMQAELIIVHLAVINFIDPVSLCVSNNAECIPESVLVCAFLLHLNSFRERFVIVLTSERVLCPSILHRANRTRRLFIQPLHLKYALLLLRTAQADNEIGKPLPNALEQRNIGLCKALNAALVPEQPVFAERRRQFAVCAVQIERHTLLCIQSGDVLPQHISRNALFLGKSAQRRRLQVVVNAAVFQMVCQLVHEHLPHRIICVRVDGDRAVFIPAAGRAEVCGLEFRAEPLRDHPRLAHLRPVHCLSYPLALGLRFCFHHRLFRRLAVLHCLGERNICVGSVAISYILAYTVINGRDITSVRRNCVAGVAHFGPSLERHGFAFFIWQIPPCISVDKPHQICYSNIRGR